VNPEPTPTAETESQPPAPTRESIEVVTTESDEHRALQAQAARAHAQSSHVLTEEPLERPLEASAAATATAEELDPDKPRGGEAGEDEPPPASADAGEADESANESDEEAEESKPKSRRARKVARLQKELSEAREQISTLETRLQDSAPAPAEAKEAPDPDQFDDWEKYADAKADWLAAEKIAEAAPAPDTKRMAPDSWGEVTDKYEDFSEVVYAPTNTFFTGPVCDQLISMADEGAELAYYLGKHPEEAKRIALVQGETAVARELGKLQATLSKPKGNGSQAPTDGAANVAPTISNAPPPITPTEGGGAQGRQADLNSADPEEYRRIRREQMKARGDY